MQASQQATSSRTKTTSTPSAPPKVEYVNETPRRARRTDAEIDAETVLGHHWVTLLSIERPIPRSFGDNHGVLPVWVEAHADWRQSGVTFDRNQPTLRAVRLVVMGVSNDVDAARLKRVLDEALHGLAKDHDADPLRHRFRNAVDFGELDVWWTPLLVQAVAICELDSRDFEVFTRAEHDRMVADRLRGRR